MRLNTSNRLLHLSGILFISLLLGACANTDSGPVIEDIQPEKELYASAVVKLEGGDYRLAIEDLEAMEARYPYGRYSKQAQLELIYATTGLTNCRCKSISDSFYTLIPRS